MKEFKPVYNEKGQVNDPRVAQQMAKQEDLLRGRPDYKNTQKEIDITTEPIGARERVDAILEDIANTIKEAISSEEMDIIKKVVKNEDTNRMELLMRKIAGE